MPGVPSGRGCEACRKQKKKCDQTQPTCSRCARLRITCIGPGVQRFKFMEDSRSSSGSPRSMNNDPLTISLVAKLNESEDLRYHIPWTYGSYIEDIPKRIGKNKALDTAAAALISTHSALRLRRETNNAIPAEAYQAYAHAVKTLREYLDIPARARESETLCAVSVLFISSSFLGEKGIRSYHGEGAAQILKARAFYDPKDDFEQMLLLCLRGPILFEALINPRIQFSLEEWKTIVENKLDETNRPEGMMLRCLSRAPGIMHRGKIALRDQTGLQMLVSDTRREYETLTAILTGLRNRYRASQIPMDGNSPKSKSRITIAMVHSHFQRTYGIGLTICMLFNCILKALDQEHRDVDMDANYFCKEILKLADEAGRYRPLCAGYIQLGCWAAWCCTDDKATRDAVEKVAADYSADFVGSSGNGVRTELEHTFRCLRLLDS